ncbi:MAG TPA: hypothetical protein VME67_23545 [Mycobacterium sp.]|nr:hypothetical protein [Mycobacterium sp.]HTX97541.1 hypothetical protein [Mycobacterium sp.]
MRTIRGPVETGTAQVLSLRQFGSVGGGAGRQVCRFRLRVEVPGREPYEVTHWQNVAPWELAAVGPGNTVSVEVDAAKPKRVRIGRGRRHPGTAGSPHTFTARFEMPPTVVFNHTTTTPAESSVAPPTPISPVVSAADLLASGQRVPGVLRSFAAMGTTPRSLGRIPSRPEMLDAPHYTLEVELHFPNLAPITGRSVQPVPVSQVPNLAIGLKLDCVVDPADPARRFIVDWPQF